MPRILRTEQSRQDYLDIWLFVAEHNERAADRLLDRFDALLAQVATWPLSGRSRDELAPTLRSVVVGRYLLFYRPIEDGIELIRVLHGARDLPRLFGRPTEAGAADEND